MPNEEIQREKQFVRDIALLTPILLIGGAIVFFTGSWIAALFFVGVAWLGAKMIEHHFSPQLLDIKTKLFSIFDVVFGETELTFLGKLLFGPENDFELEPTVEAEQPAMTRGAMMLGALLSPNTTLDHAHGALPFTKGMLTEVSATPAHSRQQQQQSLPSVMGKFSDPTTTIPQPAPVIASESEATQAFQP